MARSHKLPGPKKLTDEVKEVLIRELKNGLPRKLACARANISPDTLEYWRERAAAGKQPYAAYMVDIEQAERLSQANMVTVVLAAGFGRLPKENTKANINALMWLMKQRWPKEWGDLQRIEHTGADGSPLINADPAAAARAVREAFGDHALKKGSPDDPNDGGGAAPAK